MQNNFLEILNGMKLYMADGDYGVEEVNIPIEYFVNHEIIDEAVRNLILRFNKNPRMNKYKLNKSELKGFKVKNNQDGNVYLEIEYAEADEEPFIVQICDGYIDEKVGFKLKIDSFLREIDEILNKIFIDENMRISEQLKRGEITREEWAEKTIQLAAATPVTAEQYMSQQAEGLRAYHEYITDFPEYKEIFEEKKIVVHIAEDSVGKRRIPSGRAAKDRVNEVIDFETRKKFLEKFAKGKSFSIIGDEEQEEVYKGYIIESEQEDGVIIVMEPIDGERTTFITFESNEDLQARRELLSEMGEELTPEADIVRDVLGKTRNEKNNDPKIISKYHVAQEVYERNLAYLITGDEELLKGAVNVYKLRSDRADMISR